MEKSAIWKLFGITTEKESVEKSSSADVAAKETNLVQGKSVKQPAHIWTYTDADRFKSTTLCLNNGLIWLNAVIAN